ncbi:unnamed protein product, partial [Mesorhabditis spiculigera]
MAFLANLRIVHRDLAAKNVLMTAEKMAKVSGFAESRPEDDHDYMRNLRHNRAKLRWSAPEAVSDGRFSEKSDVWSFGVLLWEMHTFGETPFEKIPLERFPDYLNSGQTLVPPESTPHWMVELMHSCWRLKPKLRPTFCHVANWGVMQTTRQENWASSALRWAICTLVFCVAALGGCGKKKKKEEYPGEELIYFGNDAAVREVKNYVDPALLERMSPSRKIEKTQESEKRKAESEKKEKEKEKKEESEKKKDDPEKKSRKEKKEDEEKKSEKKPKEQEEKEGPKEKEKSTKKKEEDEKKSEKKKESEKNKEKSTKNEKKSEKKVAAEKKEASKKEKKDEEKKESEKKESEKEKADVKEEKKEEPRTEDKKDEKLKAKPKAEDVKKEDEKKEGEKKEETEKKDGEKKEGEKKKEEAEKKEEEKKEEPKAEENKEQEKKPEAAEAPPPTA